MEDTTRISALEEKVQQLAEQNTTLLSLLTGGADQDGGGGSPAPAEVALDGDGGAAAMDRRNMLRWLGTAAAATVGLVAANGAVNPARAADGDNIVVGGVYTGESTTFITYDSGSESTGAWGGSGGSGAGLYGTATTGVGVRGFASGTGGIAVKGRQTTNGSTAVYGTVENTGGGGTGVLGEATGDSSTLGYGVRGVTANTDTRSGAGVRGDANSGGVGVYGKSTTGFGVLAHGSGDGGVGVYAEGGDSISVRGTGVYARSTFGPPLQLTQQSITVPPTSGSWTAGQFLVKSGHVWYCIASGTGTDSTWVRLSSTFVPLDAPDRVYDSRSGFEPLGTDKGKIAQGDTRDIDATFTGSVPATASAVLLNATVAAPTGSGFVTLFPDGATRPDTASVNYGSGAIVGNNATVGLTGGFLSAYVGGSSGHDTHLIIDAYGYYA